MEFTPNLSFKKPQLTDLANITELGSNWDNIDNFKVDPRAYAYVHFKDQLTAQEITDIEANPSLMTIINSSNLKNTALIEHGYETVASLTAEQTVTRTYNVGFKPKYIILKFVVVGSAGGPSYVGKTVGITFHVKIDTETNVIYQRGVAVGGAHTFGQSFSTEGRFFNQAGVIDIARVSSVSDTGFSIQFVNSASDKFANSVYIEYFAYN